MKIQIKLSIKIFISFLLTFVVLTILMMVTIQFYSYRGFSKYVQKMEMLRLNELATLLAREYQTDRGWEDMRNNIPRLNTISESSGLLSPHHFPKPPPPPSSRMEERLTLFELNNIPKSSGLPSPHHPLKPPPPPSSRMEERLTLFDLQKQPVVGPAISTKGHTLEEIKVEGNVVGWLGLKKEERLSHPLDLAFIKQQSNAVYAIGILMLLLASVVAFFLSRHLLAPIQQLANGTRELTALRFGTKIDMHTGDELGQLVSDFNVMSKALEKYEQMRKRWVSDIAHELRTPLSILQGEIEAIQDGIHEPDQQVLESLHSEVLYLKRIVADMHDLSMADSGIFRLDRESIDCLKVLAETLGRFQNRFTQELITVRYDPGIEKEVVLQTDPTRLEQLFSNLFENVLRYVDKPGALNIWQEINGKGLNIYLEDSGPGVPDHALERLFDRLYRVDVSRARAHGGSGLGLAICRAIVEAHGGEITASNATSGGLRIRITFPLDSNWQMGG
jgi:two-component system sensor histidine kinase BaeS